MPPFGGALMQLVAYGAHDCFLSSYKPPTKKEIATNISNRIKIIPNRKYFNFNVTSKHRYGFNPSNNIFGEEYNAKNLKRDELGKNADLQSENNSKPRNSPEITFWKVNYRRQTNFTTETINQTSSNHNNKQTNNFAINKKTRNNDQNKKLLKYAQLKERNRR